MLDKIEFSDPVTLSIGLFCTWAVDTRKFNELVSEKIDISSIISMYVPPLPAATMEIVTEEERLEIPLETVRSVIPDGYLEVDDMSNDSLQRLSQGAAGKKKKAFHHASNMNLLNNEKEGERSAILMNEDVVKRIVSE